MLHRVTLFPSENSKEAVAEGGRSSSSPLSREMIIICTKAVHYEIFYYIY